MMGSARWNCMPTGRSSRGAAAYMRPVNAPGGAGLSIGNALRSGGLSCNGEIDEVKIWRLNPRRIEDEFYARPMDRETAECWRRFRREIEDAFRVTRTAPRQLGSLVKERRRQPHSPG